MISGEVYNCGAEEAKDAYDDSHHEFEDEDNKENKANQNDPASKDGSDKFHEEKVREDKQATNQEIKTQINTLTERNKEIKAEIKSNDLIIKNPGFSSMGGDPRHGALVGRAILTTIALRDNGILQKEYDYNVRKVKY